MFFKQALVLALFVSSTFAADAGLLNLVDPSAKLVAGLHVDRSVASPFGQFLLTEMQTSGSNDLANFTQMTGFDPKRDLREVIVASTDGPQQGHGLIVARGFFDIAKLTAAVKAQGGTTMKYQNLDVITSKSEAQSKSGDSGWVVFLDNQTAVAGDQALVKSAIDRRNTGSTLDPRMAAKIREVSDHYDAWMVSMVPVSHLAGNMPDAQLNGAMKGSMLQGIEMASGGVMFGSTIQITGEALTRSDKDAQALVDVVKFLAGMVQLNRDKAEAGQLASMLDTMDVKMAANSVKLTLSIPEGAIEQMIHSKPANKTVVRKVSLKK
jgi:hypothetical protein